AWQDDFTGDVAHEGFERAGARQAMRGIRHGCPAGWPDDSYNTTMISRFFCPDSVPAAGEFPLPEAVVRHAVRVLRMGEGDSLVLFDGQGGEAEATLVKRGSQWFAGVVRRSELERESPLELVLVQALATADKMDWVVQKAVELGAVRIVPVRAGRSTMKLTGERAEKRIAHWRQVAVSACEQSGRNRVPVVSPILDLREYLAGCAGAWRRLMLDPAGGERLADLGRPEGECHVLIGPEGGWSEDELAACRSAGCVG